MSKNEVFTITNRITDFYIPENGVIINGIPTAEKPILSEVEILRSKVQLLEGEIQKTREEAYEEGFSACKKSIEIESEIELQKEIKLINQFKTNLESEIKNSLLNLFEPIIAVSSEIAEKILESELESTEKLIQMIQIKLEKYCNEIANQATLNIRTNSNCINLFEGNQIKLENDESHIINFILDDSLNDGEFTIESNEHIIDATFQTQISHIINQISK
jgi:flagellar biosynthesis/type III secretory pathway protein FliH